MKTGGYILWYGTGVKTNNNSGLFMTNLAVEYEGKNYIDHTKLFYIQWAFVTKVAQLLKTTIYTLLTLTLVVLQCCTLAVSNFKISDVIGIVFIDRTTQQGYTSKMFKSQQESCTVYMVTIFSVPPLVTH